MKWDFFSPAAGCQSYYSLYLLFIRLYRIHPGLLLLSTLQDRICHHHLLLLSVVTGSSQMYKVKYRFLLWMKYFLGWKYRDYLTNSWVGSCPELINSFSPRTLSALYSTPRVFKEIGYMDVDDVLFFG